MSLARQVRARATIGWALLKRVMGQSWVPDRRLGAWTKRLANEQLAGPPGELWNYVAGSSRCLGCGLCEAVADPNDQLAEWLQALPRRPEDAPLASGGVRQRLAELAPAIARVCPAGVSSTDVAKLLEENGRALDQARGG